MGEVVKRSWAAHLPVVSVPQTSQAKHVTFIIPYYVNPRFLRHQLGWWDTYPAWLKAQISAIIVDDGSPESPASEVLSDTRHPFSIRLFRIAEDIPWNWIAARNIGMHAAGGWCVLTDIDHVIPVTTATALAFGQHDPSVIYGFSRIEHTGERITPHSASWFLTTQMFWKVGGYDERFSGVYGSDGDYRRRCAQVAPLQILTDRLIRHEYQEDSSTTRYLRKQPEDSAAVKRIIAARGAGWTPKTLSFAYAEVSCSQ